MAQTMQSVPVLVNRKFTGGASADIDARVKAAKDAVVADVDSKLANKVDTVTFQNFVNSVNTDKTGGAGTGSGTGVSYVDNGDGTITLN